MVRLLVLCLAAAACGPPAHGLFAYCSDAPGEPAAPITTPVTWAEHIRPIIERRCARCHEPGGLAPFSLRTYEELHAVRAAASRAVASGDMPPWMPAPCCGELRQDFSLTVDEKALFAAWVEQRGPRGDEDSAPPPPPLVPTLSLVDVTLEMPAPYQPMPRRGSTDDSRCFVLDWPLDRDAYVTGMNVLPGERSIVHHLVVAVVGGADGESLRAREGKDGRPGLPCAGGAFGVKVREFIGGGLGGFELPDGLGAKVERGNKIVLQIHYSTAHPRAPGIADRSRLQLRVDAQARDVKTIVVANPFWLVDEAMKVPAGEKDAVFFYRFKPVLFTKGKRVLLHGGSPHMHRFGSRFLLGVIRADGSKECLLEIPRWRFGWEQSYWLARPVPLGKDDQVYLECHFDNSAENQPLVDGVRSPPRDIAWGGDEQDMCAGFIPFTEAP